MTMLLIVVMMMMMIVSTSKWSWNDHVGDDDNANNDGNDSYDYEVLQ